MLLPKRWIVERTYGWLGRCRRLAKDYENLTRSHVGFIILAMIRPHVASNRKAPGRLVKCPDGLLDIMTSRFMRSAGFISSRPWLTLSE